MHLLKILLFFSRHTFHRIAVTATRRTRHLSPLPLLAPTSQSRVLLFLICSSIFQLYVHYYFRLLFIFQVLCFNLSLSLSFFSSFPFFSFLKFFLLIFLPRLNNYYISLTNCWRQGRIELLEQYPSSFEYYVRAIESAYCCTGPS